jgi:antitoxin ParD1/3/4
MKVTLQSDLEQFVAEKVKSGQYASADAVLNSAVSLLREQETLSAEDIAQLKRDIAVGIEQLERGESAPWDVEAIKTEGRRILAARQRRAE